MQRDSDLIGLWQKLSKNSLRPAATSASLRNVLEMQIHKPHPSLAGFVSTHPLSDSEVACLRV